MTTSLRRKKTHSAVLSGIDGIWQQEVPSWSLDRRTAWQLLLRHPVRWGTAAAFFSPRVADCWPFAARKQ